MITTIREDNFPEIYERFVKLLGGKPWVKATKDLRLQICANPLSRPQIELENREAFGLAFFDEHRMSRRGAAAWPGVQDAMNFAAQVCELVKGSMDTRGSLAYIGRVKGAFKNPSDMRAMRIEHFAAKQLFRQGANITWPDESAGPETYDFLASDLTQVPIEVECKSCSRDKGRQIPQKDSTAFLNLLLPLVLRETSQGEALVLRLEVPKRLPTSTRAQDQIAEEVIAAILEGKQATKGGVAIEIHRTHPPFLSPQSHPDTVGTALRSYSSLVIGPPRGYRMVACGSSTGVAVEVCSGTENDLMDKLWDTAKKGIRYQMTGTRPGCLILKLEGWSREELIRVSNGADSMLVAFAEKLFVEEKHAHLACVAFASDAVMVPLGDLTEIAQSCLYVADRLEGKYGNLGIGKMLLGRAPAQPPAGTGGEVTL
ncbi:TPA: hypothetical protein ACP32N_003266 [Pseudomonas aeruginosa]